MRLRAFAPLRLSDQNIGSKFLRPLQCLCTLCLGSPGSPNKPCWEATLYPWHLEVLELAQPRSRRKGHMNEICMHVYIYIYAVYVFSCLYTYTYIDIHIYIHIYTYIYTYTNIYIYIYTHVHTHTRARARARLWMCRLVYACICKRV